MTDLILVRPKCSTMLNAFTFDDIDHFYYRLLWRDDTLYLPW